MLTTPIMLLRFVHQGVSFNIALGSIGEIGKPVFVGIVASQC